MVQSQVSIFGDGGTDDLFLEDISDNTHDKITINDVNEAFEAMKTGEVARSVIVYGGATTGSKSAAGAETA